MKRTELKQIGKKTKRDEAERAEVRTAALEACHYRCCHHWEIPGPCWGPLEVHEVIDRSVRPGVQLELDYCIVLCRSHHRWVTEHSIKARQLGFSFKSHDWMPAYERAAELRGAT